MKRSIGCRLASLRGGGLLLLSVAVASCGGMSNESAGASITLETDVGVVTAVENGDGSFWILLEDGDRLRPLAELSLRPEGNDAVLNFTAESGAIFEEMLGRSLAEIGMRSDRLDFAAELMEESYRAYSLEASGARYNGCSYSPDGYWIGCCDTHDCQYNWGRAAPGNNSCDPNRQLRRVDADDDMTRCMVWLGVSANYANVVYAAIRLFGASHWNNRYGPGCDTDCRWLPSSTAHSYSRAQYSYRPDGIYPNGCGVGPVAGDGYCHCSEGCNNNYTQGDCVAKCTSGGTGEPCGNECF